MDSNLRQQFLSPFVLRIAQVLLDCTQTCPVINEFQRKEITPFFIIGSGRSGTTLLRSVLQRHTKICIPPESVGAIPNSIKKFYRYGGLDWQDLVNVILGEFSSNNMFDLWKIDLSSVRKEAVSLPEEEKSLAKIIDLIYKQYLKVHKPAAVIWGDKTPFNTLRLKWINKAFPEAKYIHIIRDGRDVVSSCLKSNLISDIGEACVRWNLSLKKVEKLEKKIGDRIFTIYYEEFVKNPESVTKQVCNFLNIWFTTDMLENDSVFLGDDHLDHLKNVNKPITSESVGKWKQRLTEEQKREVLGKLKQNLKKYDYIK